MAVIGIWVASKIYGILMIFRNNLDWDSLGISQIRYSLVVIFELNSISVVQYKNVMMIDDGKYQQE